MDLGTTTRSTAPRGLAATLGLAAMATTLARLGAGVATGAPAPDAVVGAVVIAVGALAAAGLAAGCGILTATAVAARLGHSWSRTEAVALRMVPVVLRRALAVGIGAGMAVGLGTASVADEVDVGWQVTSDVTSHATSTGSGTGLSMGTSAAAEGFRGHVDPPGQTDVVPTAAHAAVEALASVEAPAAETPAPPTPTIRVQPGDSLWTITAALLPAAATEADIAAAWPTLYAANHDAIGPDPGLIHPGDVLTVPTGMSA